MSTLFETIRQRKQKRQRRRHGADGRLLHRLHIEQLEERTLLAADLLLPNTPPLGAGNSSGGIAFEPNLGQVSDEADFLARGEGYALFLSPNSGSLALQSKSEDGSAWAGITMHIVDGNPGAEPAGQGLLSGVSNYLIGNDPDQWTRNVPHYAAARFNDVYAGVDVVYYGNQGLLEYDFIVDAGIDTSVIGLAFEGTEQMSIDEAGDLVLTVDSGELRLHKPIVYQQINDERHEIAASYSIDEQDRIGFELAAYDDSLPLVIDPVVVYSTFLGGTNQDLVHDIAVDTAGSAYVVGQTLSTDFPTVNPIQGDTASWDVFVSKLDLTGTSIVWSTYLGGDFNDFGRGIALDGDGNIYLTGETDSSNFPTTPGAFQHIKVGNDADAFMTKLDPTGTSVLYSTFFGGSSEGASGRGIAVDQEQLVYVTGFTSAANFPVTSTAFQATKLGVADGFLAVFIADPADSDPANAGDPGDLSYSTFFGGDGDETGDAVAAIGGDAIAYVTGFTQSFNVQFPTTLGAFKTSKGAGHADSFLLQIDTSKSGAASLVYGTLIGGELSDENAGIFHGGVAVQPGGDVFVTGYTQSNDFPVTAGALKTVRESTEAFVMRIDPTQPAAAQIVYATFLGGAGGDDAYDIAVDAAGNAYVTGSTTGNTFPTTPDAYQPAGTNSVDAYLSVIDPTGSQLLYSTFLGGSGGEHGYGVAVDPAGDIYVAGDTGSATFPTTAGSFQTVFAAGFEDGFVAKFSALPRANGTIGDFVWHDVDGDGVQDVGEPGIAGATVNLLNGDNFNFIANTTTDANGMYLFPGLNTGNYTIEFVLPAGFDAFTNLNAGVDDTTDSDANPVTERANVTLGATDDLTIDAGFYKFGSIGDFVWHDLDGNGLQDPGEPGLAGVEVELRDATNTSKIGSSVFTDANGLYQFTGLPPGEFYTRFYRPVGKAFTPVVDFNMNAMELKDSDAHPVGLPAQFGDAHVVFLQSGANETAIDAGFVDSASVGDYVWHDLNGNGLQDGGEPGLAGVPIELRDSATDTLIAGPIPSGDGISTPLGFYEFTDVAPGSYNVRFYPLPGFVHTLVDVNANATDHLDSDSKPQPGIPTNPGDALVVLQAGATETTIDAGQFVPGSIHGFKFEDVDGNGAYDPMIDRPMPGVSFELISGNGSPSAGPATVIDDGDAGFTTSGFAQFVGAGYQGDLHFSLGGSGNTATWSFSGLSAGDYEVATTWSPAGNRALNSPFSVFDGTAVPGNLLAMINIDQQSSPNDFVDVGADWESLGVFTISGSMLSVQLADTVSTTSFVVGDAVLIRRVNSPVATVTTNERGEFWIEGLTPSVINNRDEGGYLLREVQPTDGSIQPTTPSSGRFNLLSRQELVWTAGAAMLPPGTTTATGDQEVADPAVVTSATGNFTFTLSPDQTSLRIQGTHDVANPTAVHLHLAPAGTNGPVIFNIGANNGPGAASPFDATWDANSSPPLTPADAAALLAGDVYVNVHSETFPAGEIRGQLQFDPRREVVLSSTAFAASPLMFGNTIPGSIHGFKFEDMDGDGVYEPGDGDVGSAGVDFVLTGTDGLGKVITRRETTDANGDFWFVGLLPSVRSSGGAGYTVTEIPPFGSSPTTPPSVTVDLRSGQELVWQSGAAMLPAPVVSTFDFENPAAIDASGHIGAPSFTAQLTGAANVAPLPAGVPGSGNSWNVAPSGVAVIVFDGPASVVSLKVRLQDGASSDVRITAIDALGNVFTTSTGDLNPVLIVPPGDPTEPFRGLTFIPSGLNAPHERIAWIVIENMSDGEAAIDDLSWTTTADPRHEVLVGTDLMFGNAYLGSIHGYKFHDINADGVDNDEPRLSGVAITLTGMDGKNNSVGPLTVVTDSLGEYWFTGLLPGSYTVTETPPADSINSTPLSYTVTVKSRQELVALEGQAHLDDVDDPRREIVVGPDLAFGNYKPGSLHGRKYEDVNANGKHDPGEPYLNGWEIVLTDVAGNTTSQTTDDMDINGDGEIDPERESGWYWFTNLTPGTYTVGETQTPGWLQSAPGGNGTHMVTIGSGEDRGEVVAGEGLISKIPVGARTLAVSTMITLTQDGVPHEVSVVGIAEINVGGMGTGTEQMVQTEMTSLDLRGVSSQLGEITVRLKPGPPQTGQIVQPDGNTFVINSFFNIEVKVGIGGEMFTLDPTLIVGTSDSFPPHDVSFTTADADPRILTNRFGTPSDITITIPSLTFTQNDTVDFGNFVPGSIHAFKYEDVDGDGQYNSAIDRPFAGIDFRLTGVDNRGNTVDLTQTTDATGRVWFEGLIPSIGSAVTTAPSGSTLAGVPTGYTLTEVVTDPLIVATTPVSFHTNLLSRQEFVPAAGDAMLPVGDPRTEIVVGTELMFGNTVLGSIHGYKFEDLNGNGIDDGEPRLARVPITLSGQGVETRSELTDDNGEYWFVGLPPGDYTVRETPPTGSVPTTPSFYPVTIASREEKVALAGQAHLTEPADPRVEVVVGPELAFGNTFLGSIHGYKFHDLNADGVDNNEPRLNGVTITLTGVDGMGNDVGPIVEQTSGNRSAFAVVPAGEYWFTGLPPGTYTITETPPAGFTASTPPSYTVTIRSRQEFVALAGQAHLGANDPRVEVVVGPQLAFGNYQPGSLHGRKYEDLNANGQHDPGEPYLNDWTITLTDAGGVTVAQTTHDHDINGDGEIDPGRESGWYWFDNLRPGIFTITETQQAGWTASQAADGYTVLVVSGGTVLDASGQQLDMELTQLNLTGQSYAIPLASDPANALGDSVDGYGFVDSQVTLALSSKSFGETTATPFQGTFNVDSFFDVFFDITITDVDNRPGRDFAGQTDGASIVLQNVSAHIVSSFSQMPDASSPNFKLFPPPESNPYTTLMNVERPLGVDVNGNGENDKVKFTLMTFVVADQNRTFIQLPNGATLNQFNVSAVLNAAVLDESGDPPFMIGGGNPFLGTGTATATPSASAPGGDVLDNERLDFGNYRAETLRGSIGDFVWHDIDGNGLQDAGEPGLANVLIELHDFVSDALIDTTFSGDGISTPLGFYEFTNVPAGSYNVRFYPLPGYEHTPVDVNANGTDHLDSDSKPQLGIPTNPGDAFVVLPPGAIETTIDSGMQPIAGVDVTGGVLTIRGDSRDNVIGVRLSLDRTAIEIEFDDYNRALSLVGVDSFRIFTLGGDDKVSVDLNGFEIPVTIDGGESINGDSLSVTSPSGITTWQSTGWGSANLSNGRNQLALTGFENLIARGSYEGSTLRVLGDPRGTSFRYEPVTKLENSVIGIGATDLQVEDWGEIELHGLVTDSLSTVGTNVTDLFDFQILQVKQEGLQSKMGWIGFNPQPEPLQIKMFGISNINLDGGLGFDSINVTSDSIPGAVFDSVYKPGPAIGAGQHVILASAPSSNGPVNVEVTINFTGFEPFFDDLPGTLTVEGTDTDNAIDYRQGSTINRGLVSVDEHETIEFENKTLLTIDARAGRDDINLNNPTVPAGLQQINVVGGNSIDDSLTINGTPGLDTIGVTLDSADSGAALVNSLPVTFDLVEFVSINGQGGGDSLEVIALGSPSVIEFTPGESRDSGHVRVDARVPLEFEQLGSGVVTIADPDPGFARLIHNGYATDDLFHVPSSAFFGIGSPGSDPPPIPQSIGLNDRIPIITQGIVNYVLRGFEGNDSFAIFDGLGLNVEVEGDGSDDNDLLAFITDAAVDLDLQSSWFSVPGLTFPFSGIETLQIHSNGLNIAGTNLDDHFEFAPLSEVEAEVQLEGYGTDIEFRVEGPVTLDGLGGADVLKVVGTAEPETIVINDFGTPKVTVGERLPAFHQGFEAVNVDGRESADLIRVRMSNILSMPIFVVGGTPISHTPPPAPMLGFGPTDDCTLAIDPDEDPDPQSLPSHADKLEVEWINLGGSPGFGVDFTQYDGPENDSGSYVFGSGPALSYDEVEDTEFFTTELELNLTIKNFGRSGRLSAAPIAPGTMALCQGGKSTRVTGLTSLSIESSVDVSLDQVQNFNIPITVHGAGNSVKVTSTDVMQFEPTGQDSGLLSQLDPATGTTANPITVSGVSLLSYGGGGDLKVRGDGQFEVSRNAVGIAGKLGIRLFDDNPHLHIEATGVQDKIRFRGDLGLDATLIPSSIPSAGIVSFNPHVTYSSIEDSLAFENFSRLIVPALDGQSVRVAPTGRLSERSITGLDLPVTLNGVGLLSLQGNGDVEFELGPGNYGVRVAGNPLLGRDQLSSNGAPWVEWSPGVSMQIDAQVGTHEVQIDVLTLNSPQVDVKGNPDDKLVVNAISLIGQQIDVTPGSVNIAVTPRDLSRDPVTVHGDGFGVVEMHTGSGLDLIDVDLTDDMPQFVVVDAIAGQGDKFNSTTDADIVKTSIGNLIQRPGRPTYSALLPSLIDITLPPKPNQPPVANDDSAMTDEDTAVFINVSANDTDAESNSLSYSITAPPTNGTAVVQPGGFIKYMPNPNFNGTDTFQYKADDGAGPSNEALVTILVKPVNDAPGARGDSATTNEDTPVSISVLGNDTDFDGDTLFINAITMSPANGKAFINVDNTITYTPNPNFNGTDFFQYQNWDGTLVSPTAVVVITVNPVNDPPVANNDAVTTDEDTAIFINVMANDQDVDGDQLTIIITAPPQNGTAVVVQSGIGDVVKYTPPPNFNGSASFKYRVNDGTVNSAEASVTITVNPVNDAPVAKSDSATTDQNTPVVIDVLANDTDLEGDPLEIILGPTGNGTTMLLDNGTPADPTDDKLKFTPAPGFSGIATISYQVEDGNLPSNQALVTITVNPAVPDPLPPEADAGGPYTVNEGDFVTLFGSASSGNTPLTYAWDLDNDGQFDDANGSTPTFSAIPLDGPSTHIVSLRVTDAANLTATATTTVSVLNVAPTADAGGPYLAFNGLVQLAGKASDPGLADGLVFEWDFDLDSQFDDATGPQPIFAAGSAPSYLVSLRVTDDDGGFSIDTTTVTRVDFNGGSLADLTVSTVVTSQIIPRGAVISNTVTVTNNGPDVAKQSISLIDLPSGFALEGSLPSGCELESRRLTCQLGDIAVGGMKEIELSVRLNELGKSQFVAAVFSEGSEPQTENNVSNTVVLVLQRFVPPSSGEFVIRLIGDELCVQQNAASLFCVDAQHGGLIVAAAEGEGPSTVDVSSSLGPAQLVLQSIEPELRPDAKLLGTEFTTDGTFYNVYGQNGTLIRTDSSPWTNLANYLDVDGDGVIAAKDVLNVVNRLISRGSGPLGVPTPSNAPTSSHPDVFIDGVLSPLDALLVVNFLNRALGLEGEAEADDAGKANHSLLVDEAIAQFAQPRAQLSRQTARPQAQRNDEPLRGVMLPFAGLEGRRASRPSDENVLFPKSWRDGVVDEESVDLLAEEWFRDIDALTDL
ncbi:MAG: tandem-95 repeat protein [Planctomycetota bacterium]|nr:tandem-95 repeat protein [Planctomycetota bacterium]